MYRNKFGRWLYLVLLSIVISLSWTNSMSIAQSADQSGAATLQYPAAHRGDQVDDYHGTKVADPYRWLENIDSAETRDWVQAESKLTNAFLEKIPQRDAIRKRLTVLWNYPKYSVPRSLSGRYFFTKNTGLQN